MIPVIDELVEQWARWKDRRGAWSSCVPWARLMTECEVFVRKDQFIPVNELDCQQIDRCIVALDPPLYKAVVEKYLFPAATMEQRCYNCRCSERMFYYRIDAAHRAIARMLYDWAANGVEPRPYARPASHVDTVAEN
jgi:hypothetical protein